MWIAAVARLEAAEAKRDAYGKQVCDPAERAYFKKRRVYPKFQMATKDDQDESRAPIEWSVGILRKFGGGEFSDNDSELAVYAASQMPIIQAIDEYNEALSARLELQAKEAEYERLLDLNCDARDDVFSMPSPDWAALTYKLRLLAQHSHLAAEEGDDDPLPMITADAERLTRDAVS